jgi:hypothetical protein
MLLVSIAAAYRPLFYIDRHKLTREEDKTLDAYRSSGWQDA